MGKFKRFFLILNLLTMLLFLASCNSNGIFELTDGKNTGSLKIYDDLKNEILSYEFSFDDGATVYDALMYSAKQKKIAVEKKGFGNSIYISSIAGISEFDKGAKSGWIYKVNGEILSISCNDYKLTDKDKIEWIYSIDLGKDVQ